MLGVFGKELRRLLKKLFPTVKLHAHRLGLKPRIPNAGLLEVFFFFQLHSFFFFFLITVHHCRRWELLASRNTVAQILRHCLVLSCHHPVCLEPAFSAAPRLRRSTLPKTHSPRLLFTFTTTTSNSVFTSDFTFTVFTTFDFDFDFDSFRNSLSRLAPHLCLAHGLAPPHTRRAS